ncbi:MAG TPA: N-acetylglucosamine-6-phosphate deacetylase [Chthoniobacteraceae bacterium]|jgi:N-acetylglucosamine-6-phosphate deacetylase|nr:N-acetylglucosamine-6-phosphate deacetylase [Chthoniobacteraceae bacterium]
MIAPALFDLQVNGFAGVDFQQPDLSRENLRHAVEALRRHGTGGILLTLITDEVSALCRKLERLERLREQDETVATMICGYHLEGPWLSPEPGFRGAHPAGLMRAPDVADYRLIRDAAGGRLRLVTLAPELPGSDELITAAGRDRVVISLGHTDATEAQIECAIAAGAALCTHVGNGVPMTLPRHDNIVQRLLARDELTACFIPDGVHLPQHVLRNFVRSKPPGRAILTTDATAAAGAPAGRYRLGRSEIESDGETVRQPGQPHLAGSSLTPDRGVSNAAKWLGISQFDARALFSTTPAGLFDIKLPMSELTPV